MAAVGLASHGKHWFGNHCSQEPLLKGGKKKRKFKLQEGAWKVSEDIPGHFGQSHRGKTVSCALRFSRIPQNSQLPHAEQVPSSPLAWENSAVLHQPDQAINKRSVKWRGQMLSQKWPRHREWVEADRTGSTQHSVLRTAKCRENQHTLTYFQSNRMFTMGLCF